MSSIAREYSMTTETDYIKKALAEGHLQITTKGKT